MQQLRKYPELKDDIEIQSAESVWDGKVYFSLARWCGCPKKNNKTRRWRDEPNCPWLPLVEENNWLLCAYCRCPPKEDLTQCPQCGRLWRGPRRNFPFMLECPDCE